MPNSRFALWLMGLGLLVAAAPAIAQPTPAGEADRNVRLRVQLDRASIAAFEPVYLSLSAEQFAENLGLQIAIRKGNDPWQYVVFPEDVQTRQDPWKRFESHSTPGLPLLKMGVPLLVGVIGDTPRFIFSTPGEYRIRVKIGPDSPTLKLTVVTPTPDDKTAAEILGTDLFPKMFELDYRVRPDEKLKAAAARVIAELPGSTTARYCEAYLRTVKFRSESMKHDPPTANKAFYGPLADELEKSAAAFEDSFFGEELSFYAAYAHGLSGDFKGLLKIAEARKTTLTPWADALYDMKKDVQKHLRPAGSTPVPVDPDSSLPPSK